MTLTARDQFVASVSELIDEDPSRALVLADITVRDFAALASRRPSQVVNVGIREQALIGVTAGLSLAGLRPFAHSYVPFLLERPFEQVKLDLSHQGLGAVLVSVGASYDAADSGRTHHGPGDVALLDTLGDWTVHVPGHPGEVDGLLREAAAGSGRVYVRLSEQENAEPVAGGHRLRRRGSPGAPLVIAVGPLADAAFEATSQLDVTFLQLTTVRPFPAGLVRSLAGRDVILVEPYLAGTSLPAAARAVSDLPHRLLGLGVERVDLHRFGTPQDHDAAQGLDASGIARRVAAFLRIT